MAKITWTRGDVNFPQEFSVLDTDGEIVDLTNSNVVLSKVKEGGGIMENPDEEQCPICKQWFKKKFMRKHETTWICRNCEEDILLMKRY